MHPPRKLAIPLLLAAFACAPARACPPSGATEFLENGRANFSDVLPCYRQEQANLPLIYTKTATENGAGIEKRSYQLESQSWQPGFTVGPEKWTHAIDIFIPDNAISERALLVINNGINLGSATTPAQGPSDFTESGMRSIAAQTRTIIISVSNVPNQFLKYQDDDTPKKEDDSVAHSWKLFLANPTERPFASLHVPMMEVVVKTMDLAQKELKQWNIQRFIAAGASKRGWAAWHAAIADRRIDAIVPFVFDGLNTKKMMEHTYQVYGNHWPIALTPYVREGVMDQIDTRSFNKLMDIEDPLRYLDTAYAARLAIPKYIVNASGDDFFTPDNARLYFDKLPGIKTLRVAPNSNHYGIKEYMENSLVPFTRRLQGGVRMPMINSEVAEENGQATIAVRFSETPTKIVKWLALNAQARDFRFACGIRYAATPLALDKEQELHLPAEKPSAGWAAMFIEAQFADGFTATTPVYISPDSVYPDVAPPSSEPACKTLP
ncbi:PhoPQ-activated pathogenicity-related protein [Oxalobacteraceae bacterium GrIS 1.11]